MIYRLNDRLFPDLRAAARYAAKTGLDVVVLAAEEEGQDRPAYGHEREQFSFLVERYGGRA